MLIKKGQYKILPEENKVSDNGSKKVEFGNPVYIERALKTDKTSEIGKDKKGNNMGVDLGSGSVGSKTKAIEIKSDKKSRIYRKKLEFPDWGNIVAKSSSRGSMSPELKRLIKELTSNEPLVNWKKELTKFFDNYLKTDEWVLPNKRMLGTGNILYGRKSGFEDSLRTVVVAIDTSGQCPLCKDPNCSMRSMPVETIKVFLSEIVKISKECDAERTIIIYCSDDIDAIDILDKKNKVPDLSKIKSTGGNSKGLIPPFAWLQKEKIVPSVFVYFTDTNADMPDPGMYNIRKYAKKTVWFVCSPELYNNPPFGKVLYVPLASIAGGK